MHNGRPLTLRKKIQLLLALTILAWATQTLLAQWARGEQPDPQTNQAFVPREGSLPGATLELRSEARVLGAEVKLKHICRWSDTDAAMFTPVADVVLTKLEVKRPYRVISVPDVRQLLEGAGINVALVRFSGPLECSVSRMDTELKEADALDQWVKAHEAPTTQPVVMAADPPQPRAEAGEQDVRTLRSLLVSDLAVRLSIPQDQLVMSFDPRDESALSLSEPPFKFNVLPRRVRDLGVVEWDVTIVSPTGSRKAQIRATARAWQNQVVVNRPLTRQQVIQDGDITERRTLVDRVPSALPLKRDQVIAQMTARDLRPGVVLTAPLVEAVPLAKVGQFISVTLDRGSVRIKTVAKALEGGCYGDTIRVKNEATKNIYQVTLTGPQEASLAADRT